MTIPEIMKKMIEYSNGNNHDINHFMKVFTYARTIGQLENLDEQTQFIIEAAAITHDIACPLCRKKYGNTNGKYQEQEGIILVYDFFKDSGLAHNIIDRIAYLVGHHHTFSKIDGLDYQILVEADYLVNADESSYSPENIRIFCDKTFWTETGKALLESVFLCSHKDD